jgi:hypothetical protein
LVVRELEATIQGLIDTSQSTERDMAALHKDGSMLPVRLSLNMKKDGSKFIFTAIFQKK